METKVIEQLTIHPDNLPAGLYQVLKNIDGFEQKLLDRNIFLIHNNKWAEDILIASAAPHKTPGEWKKNKPRAYYAAGRLKILDLCQSHMLKQRIKWTEEEVKKSALQYKTPKEWEENEPNAYYAAARLKILDLCQRHMKKRRYN